MGRKNAISCNQDSEHIFPPDSLSASNLFILFYTEDKERMTLLWNIVICVLSSPSYESWLVNASLTFCMWH
jgi:hypothetical protein